MTTEEKLQHFLDSCVSDASSRSEKMLADYRAALEKTFEDHKTDSRRRQAMELQTESEKIKREGNKQLSLEHMELRRKIGQMQEELKDKLFVELKDRLDNFMETSAYHDLLERQIRDAMKFADGEEMTIYLDPADEDQAQRLSLHHGANIKVSKYSFMGGTRAVIPAKNILIDNSFASKIDDAREKFHFGTAGGTEHE